MRRPARYEGLEARLRVRAALARWTGLPGLPRRRQRIGVYPASWNNPYLSLLYAGMSARHVPLETVSRGAALYRRGRIDLMHVHFEGLYAGPGGGKQGRDEAVAGDAFLADLAAFKADDGRLAWTLHDDRSLRPQEFTAKRREVRAWLAGHADMVHVHSEAGRDVAVALGAPAERVEVVAHPSYGDAYGRPAPPAPPPDARRFLCFGAIRPSKDLGHMFNSLGAADIAPERYGTCVVSGALQYGMADPTPLLPSNRRVELRLGRVPAAQVGALFEAADYCILPYRRSLTSGVAALSLTMGVPVVAPDIGGLREMLPQEGHGLLYDPDDPDALTRALERAAALPAEAHLALQRACLARARDTAPEVQSRALEVALVRRGLL